MMLIIPQLTFTMCILSTEYTEKFISILQSGKWSSREVIHIVQCAQKVRYECKEPGLRVCAVNQ